MQFSENTMEQLKNFASINSNILFPQGNIIKTMSVTKTILSVAEIEENIPNNFGIYNLSEFLNVLSLVDNPTLNFEKEFVTIADSSGISRVQYYYSSLDVLTLPPDKEVNMPEVAVKFTLTNDNMNRIKKAASTLSHSEISITSGNNGLIKVLTSDTRNATSNKYSLDIAGEYDLNTDFEFITNTMNLKMLPGDYDVEIAPTNISKFTNKDRKVTYWVAFEKSSTYNKGNSSE